ncbi:MAG TPA: hypothetical protein VFF47_02335 [Nitrospirota bacterium]|nr:hypothetical protein [Nitrospirota bacterium]
MTLSGCASAATGTANDGTYSFNGLADGGCTFTPSLSGHAFIPPRRLVTLAGSDVSSQDFSAVQTWFEENYPAITYTGTWNSLVCNPCKNGFLKYSGQTGDSPGRQRHSRWQPHPDHRGLGPEKFRLQWLLHSHRCI